MHIDVSILLHFAERLRLEAIGHPEWLEEKQVYEYREQSAKVVAVLKSMRAAQGVTALSKLCQAGLFIDFGVAIRCVYDSLDEAYFLLENYPKTSRHVEQFIKGFFENTIDGYLSTQTHSVQTAKIRAARVRILKGDHDDATQKLLERLYKTFSGYVHSNYSHIMEIYGGPNRDFNLGGIFSSSEVQKRWEHVTLAANGVFFAITHVAKVLGLAQLHEDCMKIIMEYD